MRRPVTALFAAGLLVAGFWTAVAAASPISPHFTDLIVELNARDSNLPTTGLTKEQKKEKAALARAFKALSAESVDLSEDLTMARKMAGALEKGYPGDATIEGLLDDLDGNLSADVATERDDVVVLISIAEAGKMRMRAEAKLSAGDTLLVAAESAATRASRARYRERGHKAITQAAALAVKAGPGGETNGSTMSAVVAGFPWAANSTFGTAVSGLADVSGATSGLRKIVISGRRILPRGSDNRLPGATARIQITLTSANQNVVPGVYTTGNSNGVNASAYWMTEDEEGDITQAVSIAGTIEVTALAVHAGSVDIAGTFSLTMYDGLADAQFDISGGAFDAAAIFRNTIE